MLDLQERELFIEALRPPEGFSLDGAIGTTYSLDLLSLLYAPVAFTLFSLEENEQGTPKLEPTIVLESLRRNAGKLAIFCQAGQTYTPAEGNPLFAYLEDVVVPVDPGTGGVFHPKVWVLRFISPDEGVRYRLLCASRNLTFDRSWDSMVCLEGPLADRKVAYAQNHPLGDFVKRLPELATGRPVPDRISEMVKRFEYEVRRVNFEIPQPFEGVRFWAGGVAARGDSPFSDRCDRALVVSPFCTAAVLESLVGEAGDHTLVSRPAALAALPEKIWKTFARVAVLSDSAEAEASGESDATTSPDLTGLHAKIYVFDQGWNATVWTGSANATAAAFRAARGETERNVEFLVGLTGPRAKCGVNAILGPREGATTLSDLITDFPRPEAPGPIEPEVSALDEVRASIARIGLKLTVRHGTASGSYFLECSAPASAFALPPEIKATCRPISLNSLQHAQSFPGSGPLTFGPVGLDGISAFLAFELVKGGAKSETAQFVLNLPVEGMPDGRSERLLKSILKNPEGVARFIGFLLADENDPTITSPVVPTAGAENTARASRPNVQTLFEQLVRALHRDPARIDSVQRFIEDLGRDPSGGDILPAGFDQIWPPILEARQRLKA